MAIEERCKAGELEDRSLAPRAAGSRVKGRGRKKTYRYERGHPRPSTINKVITLAVNALADADPGFETSAVFFIFYLLGEIPLFRLFCDKKLLVYLVESTTTKIIRKPAVGDNFISNFDSETG